MSTVPWEVVQYNRRRLQSGCCCWESGTAGGSRGAFNSYRNRTRRSSEELHASNLCTDSAPCQANLHGLCSAGVRVHGTPALACARPQPACLLWLHSCRAVGSSGSAAAAAWCDWRGCSCTAARRASPAAVTAAAAAAPAGVPPCLLPARQGVRVQGLQKSLNMSMHCMCSAALPGQKAPNTCLCDHVLWCCSVGALWRAPRGQPSRQRCSWQA